MSLLLSVRERLLLPAIFLAFPFFLSAQTNTAVPQGNETQMTGPLAGDQIYPSISINQNGGYLTWEENGSLKSGSEIKAVRLNSGFSRISSFPVAKLSLGDQRNPQVQLLNNGNAIFAWQGNGLKTSDIYARILKGDGTFLTSDLRLNSYTKDQQSEPAVTPVGDGGALVAWQSLGQDGSMMGIYARLISPSGTVLSNEFLVNQITSFNQRSPAVTTLANGNVVIVWVSEQERFFDSVDIYGRLFDSAGNPVSEELLLNSGNNPCANPSITALASGGFTVVWSEKDLLSRSNNWEVIGRSFSSGGIAAGADFKVNTNTYGDQYRPKIAAMENDCAVVWTSLGQDGSREGVFGRLLQGGVQPSGNEFRVNNSVASQQIHPAVAAHGGNQFFVGWSSFVAINGFDLFGRKYILNQQQ